ncbi:MAG: hypothetical protein HJJLKODD_00234 [Phycisphaerae bacterium]|nr:hypothetical protein [Phycisphaerae bacterium]
MNRLFTRIGLLMLGGTLLLATAARADEAPAKPLDRDDSEKLLLEAEKHMVNYRLSHPMEPLKENGEVVPNFQADPESPLLGKIVTLKIRDGEITPQLDVRALQPQGSAEEESAAAWLPIGPGLQGGLKTNLKKLYDFNKLYNDHRLLRSEFDNLMDSMQHELRIRLPDGYALPEGKKIDDDFRVVFSITCVEWDHGTALPHLIIHGRVIKCDELDIKAAQPEKSTDQPTASDSNNTDQPSAEEQPTTAPAESEN